MTSDERLERYARLAVEVAVNLQPGQFLRVNAEPEHLPLVRAIGKLAYERGARYVETQFRDMHVRRARVQHAPEDSLDWSPPWSLALVDHLIDTRGATITITGESEPELLADTDQRRAQRTRAQARDPEAPGRGEPAFDPVDDRRLPERGLGERRLRGARRRAPLAGSGDRDPPRRARPCGRLARASRQASRSRWRNSTSAGSTPFGSRARAPTSSSGCAIVTAG